MTQSIPAHNLRPLFIQKIWQDADPSLWLQIYNPEQKKKLFLRLAIKKEYFGCQVFEHKPDNLQSSGSLVEIARKYIENGLITRISKLEGKFRTSIEVEKKEGTFEIFADFAKPPKILLLEKSSNTVLVQATAQGFFTKKRTMDETILEPIDAPAIEITMQIFTQETEEKKPETPKAPSSDLQKKLKRKRKSLQKALEKINASRASDEEILQLQKKCEELPYGVEKDKAYQLLKKKKRSQHMAQEYFEKVREELAKLDLDLLALENNTDINNLTVLAKKWQLSDPTPQSHTITNKKKKHQPFRKFQVHEKWSILVGKEAHDNDVLTKSAKSNDFWLHAAGPGSHVVIPSPSKKLSIQDLPSDIKRKAAILALHFSQQKKSSQGDVTITTRQHLRKTKDLNPGQ